MLGSDDPALNTSTDVDPCTVSGVFAMPTSTFPGLMLSFSDFPFSPKSF